MALKYQPHQLSLCLKDFEGQSVRLVVASNLGKELHMMFSDVRVLSCNLQSC